MVKIDTPMDTMTMLIMILLITTLLKMPILIPLNMGESAYNDNTLTDFTYK
jgi:hypothetical protein